MSARTFLGALCLLLVAAYVPLPTAAAACVEAGPVATCIVEVHTTIGDCGSVGSSYAATTVYLWPGDEEATATGYDYCAGFHDEETRSHYREHGVRITLTTSLGAGAAYEWTQTEWDVNGEQGESCTHEASAWSGPSGTLRAPTECAAPPPEPGWGHLLA